MILTDDGAVLTRSDNRLAWYTTDLASGTGNATTTSLPATSGGGPAPASTSTGHAASSTHAHTASSTSAGEATTTTVSSFAVLEYCTSHIASCQQRVCPETAANTLKNQTCLGIKCTLYCVSEIGKYDCWSVLPKAAVCAPQNATDQPCNANCTQTYHALFGPHDTPATHAEGMSTMASHSHASATPPKADAPSPVGGDDDSHMWVWIAVAIGAFWVLIAAGVGFYMFRKKKMANRYVLLELDDSDDENRGLLG